MTIDVKDGKIRYAIENIVYNATLVCGSGSTNQKQVTPMEQFKRRNKLTERIFDDVTEKFSELVSDLTKALRISQKKKDDW